MSSPQHDLHINDFISSISENEAPVNPITLTLNIQAEIFTPSNEINMNCRMGAIMVTILILSTFSVYELNINNEQVVNDTDPKIILKNLKNANPNKIIIGHLNINSIRKKLECLTYVIDKNIDIFLISETKLNDTFPERQFVIDGYHPPYRPRASDEIITSSNPKRFAPYF